MVYTTFLRFLTLAIGLGCVSAQALQIRFINSIGQTMYLDAQQGEEYHWDAPVHIQQIPPASDAYISLKPGKNILGIQYGAKKVDFSVTVQENDLFFLVDQGGERPSLFKFPNSFDAAMITIKNSSADPVSFALAQEPVSESDLKTGHNISRILLSSNASTALPISLGRPYRIYGEITNSPLKKELRNQIISGDVIFTDIIRGQSPWERQKVGLGIQIKEKEDLKRRAQIVQRSMSSGHTESKKDEEKKSAEAKAEAKPKKEELGDFGEELLRRYEREELSREIEDQGYVPVGPGPYSYKTKK